MVAEVDNQLVGGLVWCHGTPRPVIFTGGFGAIAGKGIASQILLALENETAKRGRLYMRLEVAKSISNSLEEKLGYQVFGHDYYDDHDAHRMQKNIRRNIEFNVDKHTPWYQQTTEFTCGPAALLMAMSSLNILQ